MKIFSFQNNILLFIILFIPHILYASEIFTVQAGAFSMKKNAKAGLKAYGKRLIEIRL